VIIDSCWAVIAHQRELVFQRIKSLESFDRLSASPSEDVNLLITWIHNRPTPLLRSHNLYRRTGLIEEHSIYHSRESSVGFPEQPLLNLWRRLTDF
jgi:hypothetical protein